MSERKLQSRILWKVSIFYNCALCIAHCALLTLLIQNGSSSAQVKFNFSEIKSKNPDYDAYVLYDKADIRIAIVNEKLEITSDLSSQVLYLTDKANAFASRSLYYYDETEEISNVKALSYVPQDNGKYKAMQVDKIYTQKPVKSGIFYDDFKEIYFNFLGLKEGAVSSCSYTQKFKDPHFMDPYYFAYNAPVASAECSVTFPKEVSIKYLLKGDTSSIVFSRKETKTTVTYSWKAENLRSYRDEREEGNARKYLPHIILYVDKYTVGNKTIPVLSDLNQLYKWYYGHINDLVSEAPAANIKTLSDSLTAGLNDDLSKIKSIYYWVQENIKYIAFEEGLGGFVPRKAELICSRRYGDCKDKTSLLYALFKAAGIKANFTWIGTREIPYSYYEVPTPIVDNHMIIALNRDGKWNFLDGTEMGLLYGLPSAFIQEKEALISLGKDSFVVVKVPAVEMKKNFNLDSLVLNIKDNNLQGFGYSYFGGLWKRDLVVKLSDISVKKQQEVLGNMLKYGNNKCKTDSITFEGNGYYSDSITFKYRLEIPDYIRRVDNKLFVNLHLQKFWQDAVIKPEEQKTELKYNYKYTSSQVAVLNIPKGYTVTHLPENDEHKEEFFGYSITYRKDGEKVIMVRSIFFNELEKPVSQFKAWNDMLDKLNDAYTTSLVLEKKTITNSRK